ncbi:MAG: UbiA family prenyltransferase [Minisyncoccia bacterium]|jgi:chlorophyll synthase
MITRALKKIEGVTAPLWQWGAGFVGILFVRFFLENFSNPVLSFPGIPDAATLVHYFLFYFGVFISSSLILCIFVPNITKVTKFLFFGFPILWLPPIVDLIVSHGGGYRMAYVFPTNIISFFATALWSPTISPLGGVTPGIHAELVVIIIGILGYVFIKTRSVGKSVGATVLIYCAWVFWIAFPAFLGKIAGVPSFALLISAFSSPRLLQNLIQPNLLPSYAHAAEVVFNGGISVIFYVLDFLLMVVWAILYNVKFARAIAKNLRFTRLVYYVSLVVIGALVAVRMFPPQSPTSWIDIFLFASLVISYFCAWAFAVGINDLADIKIDAASNPDRPLPSGAATASDFGNANSFFLVWLLVGGFICGYWTFFTVLVFTAAYYIYSAPPLRMKRVPILPSFLISLASLSAFTAGFYFIDTNKFVFDLPMRLAALIVVHITLAANLKDIKDIAGDRADGIWTIPVLFGKEKGKQIVGAMFAVAFLAVPTILHSWTLFLPSLMAAILGYIFTVMKNYREGRVFALYFAYVGVAGILLWMLPVAQW